MDSNVSGSLVTEHQIERYWSLLSHRARKASGLLPTVGGLRLRWDVSWFLSVNQYLQVI